MTYLLGTLQRINWRLVAAALCAVGILHILATLAAPGLAPSHALEKLTADLQRNTMQVLPPITPSTQPLPFMSPDARYAICPFDARNGAVTLTATLPGPGWILALYTDKGDNFFASIAQPGRRRDVSLLLVPTEDQFNMPAANAPETAATNRNATLTVAAKKGLAVVRAPDMGEPYVSRNLAVLRRAKCAYRKL